MIIDKLNLSFIVLLVLLNLVFGEIHKVLEYKYSFKPPHITRPDGTIPFWDRFGNAIASNDNIRVTPSLRSQKGSIWCKNKTTFLSWEVEIVFRVSGRGRIGADGLGFWYIEEKLLDGSVFGGPDMWKGLAIFFDSFDNDNKDDNPQIIAIVNDGTKQYQHQSDGLSQKFASCIKDYRNKPFPLRARIRYYNKVLTMGFTNGMSNGHTDEEYENCFQIQDLNLPEFGYFGVSAATGGLADDHDVQKFLTYRLVDGDFNSKPEEMIDHTKYDLQYLEMQQKLEAQKFDYKKEHPEAAIHKKEADEEEIDEFWENEEYGRELGMIFKGQGQLKLFVSVMQKQIDDLTRNQDSLTNSINNYKNNQAKREIEPIVNNSPERKEVFERYEIENLLVSNVELLKTAEIIKSELWLAIAGIEKISKPAQGQIPGITSGDPEAMVHEIIADVHIMGKEVNSIGVKILSQAPICPNLICISTKVYVSFSLITTAIILLYLIYKDNYSETPVKKFY